MEQCLLLGVREVFEVAEALDQGSRRHGGHDAAETG
jgi:hypothetical protein